MGTEVKQTYGIKVSTILNATEKLTEDLEYLCSLVEKADPEFKIKNAIAYSHAVMILSNHLAEQILAVLAQDHLMEHYH